MAKTWGQYADELIACKTPEDANLWLTQAIKEHSQAHSYSLEKSEWMIRESLAI